MSHSSSNISFTGGSLLQGPVTGTYITGSQQLGHLNNYSSITQSNSATLRQSSNISDQFLPLTPQEETEQDYSKILEDAFGKKNDYALENPIRDEALRKLETYIEKYADLESEFRLPPMEITQTTDKEKDLNDRYDLLLKSRGYDEDVTKPPPPLSADSADATNADMIKTPATPPSNPIYEEIQSEFDHETYSKLHKQYITYFSSILKQYHDTHSKLLASTKTFTDLREWINDTPAGASMTDELAFKAIDATITDLNLPTTIETLTHLAYKINTLTSSNPQHRSKHICTVCVIDEIDTVIRECGHTFCNTCLKTQTRCPKCRKEPITKSKIYIE